MRGTQKVRYPQGCSPEKYYQYKYQFKYQFSIVKTLTCNLLFCYPIEKLVNQLIDGCEIFNLVHFIIPVLTHPKRMIFDFIFVTL